jgi:hypothetical protein
MAKQHSIEWNAAQQVAVQVTQAELQEQARLTEEFLSSKCDSFSSADFYYYAEGTGKGIDWVKQNAQFSDYQGENDPILDTVLFDNDYDLAELFLI